MMKASSALVILSGGQDSATCLYWAEARFARLEAITFDYGQRHRVELECAERLSRKVGALHKIVPVNSLATLVPSALTDQMITVREKGGLHDLPSTFVPGRNILFLALAGAYAATREIQDLVIGACETDFSGYPDCRESFMISMEAALAAGLGGPMRIHRPLTKLTKAETFKLAEDLGCLDTIIRETHTCYEGARDELHAWGYGCGRCPACELRRKGYEEFKNHG